MIRSFIAIDLPESVRRDLAQLQERLRRVGAPVSWGRPQGIHLTLKFLGDIDPDLVPQIGAELRAITVQQTPFRLQPKTCGAFPGLNQIRVLWVGLDGPLDTLKALQERIEAALERFGFPPEQRPFKAHLTLGRVKGCGRESALQEALLDLQHFQSEAFDVTGLVLYRSELSPHGARYSALEHAPFGG